MLERSAPRNQLKALNRSNPIGMKLEFNLIGNTARSEFVLNQTHQGLSGFVHEGIIAFLMDSGFGWIARHGAGVNSVTARMEIEFHNLAPIGETLIMTVQITKNTTRLLEESVRIERQDRTLIAEGTSLQYIMSSNEDLGRTT